MFDLNASLSTPFTLTFRSEVFASSTRISLKESFLIPLMLSYIFINIVLLIVSNARDISRPRIGKITRYLRAIGQLGPLLKRLMGKVLRDLQVPLHYWPAFLVTRRHAAA